MITEQDVYVAYRRAKSFHTSKGFRLPKEWDEYFNTKLTPTNREYLTKTAGYFNTVWSNINMDEYMLIGFELFKTFSYHMFLNPKILTLYIEKDKQKKRRIGISRDSIQDSFSFIKDFIKDIRYPVGYNKLQAYCKLQTKGTGKYIIGHYLQNKIDPLLFVYCLYYKYLKLTDIEREYAYNISNRYRELLEQMFEIEDFIKEQEKK